MPDDLIIQSHKGPYTARFDTGFLASGAPVSAEGVHVLVDARIADLYAGPLADLLSLPTTIRIEATEHAKAIQQVVPVIQTLVDNRIRRDQRLIAIGGGVVQDITCFIASTLLRGVEWRFVPTTLLAQADSCIGSKSSINLGATKNILGTFYPPREVIIDTAFLDTLDPVDVRSGIGEILKVHAIAGREAYDGLAAEFDKLTTDRAVLLRFIRESLVIKRRYIELDEFDVGPRNIFNYGHSFGHAIEAATAFAVPHGIAVTMGMEIANRIATERGILTADQHQRMRPPLRANYEPFATQPLAADAVLDALTRDKKNTATELGLILPTGDDAAIERVYIAPDATFRAQLAAAIESLPA